MHFTLLEQSYLEDNNIAETSYAEACFEFMVPLVNQNSYTWRLEALSNLFFAQQFSEMKRVKIGFPQYLAAEKHPKMLIVYAQIIRNRS